VDAEIEEELRAHLAMAIEDGVRAGMSEEEARRAARMRFGNPVVVKERTVGADAALGMESLWRDLKFALRQMKKSPGYSASVVVTLTLAIGVNTAVFSMLDGFLLRKLPYREPDRIAALMTYGEGTGPHCHCTTRNEDDGTDTTTWQALKHTVTAAIVAAYGTEFGLSDGVNLDAGSAGNHVALYVHSARVSENYFRVLGIGPYLGRGFTAEEDRAGGPNAAVLSYGLWRTVFHGNKNIVGQAIEVKGEPFTVVGVLPAGAVTPNPAQIWVPVRAGDPNGVCGGGDNCGVLMRLKPGATWQEVAAQLNHLPRPDYLDSGYTKTWFYAQPLQQYESHDMRPQVEALMLAVALILLIACANLAGLTLVRVSERAQEMATRLALGASQAAVLRQIWVESLALGLLGSGAGVCVAVLILTGLQRVLPTWMIPAGGFSLDWRVFGFALGAAVATSLIFGVLPALAIRRMDLRASLAASRRSVSGGSGRVRRVLIGGEVALTLVLLAAAGLLVRTLVHLETLPPGFDPHDVMTAKASLNDARYRHAAAFHSLLNESVAAMKRIPGVEDAAVGLSTPYERGLNLGLVVADGPLAGTKAAKTGSSTAYVTPGYFRVLRIPLLAGRAFAAGDSVSSEPVAVVNESFARTFFHEANAVGRHFTISNDSGRQSLTIVGVVQDVVKEPGWSARVPLGTEPVFYIPAAQVMHPAAWHVWFQPSWIVRTRGEAPGLTVAMQKALASVDPDLPFSGFYSMDQLMDRELQTQRVEVLLLGVLAGLALLLSAVGIYALVSNLVVQRTREIGIRLALGSPLNEAIRHIASSGLTAAFAGAGAGLVCSFFALRAMRSAIYGVRPTDPVTLTVVAFMLLAVAGVASLLPALRITRIDPAATLRAE
jgi:predicted permease